MKEIQSNYDHVKKFEVTIALVGTMKAGKSTVINSFVGKELSPHRTLSMTAVPTIFTHTTAAKIPELFIPHVEYYTKAVEFISQRKDVYFLFLLLCYSRLSLPLFFKFFIYQYY